MPESPGPRVQRVPGPPPSCILVTFDSLNWCVITRLIKRSDRLSGPDLKFILLGNEAESSSDPPPHPTPQRRIMFTRSSQRKEKVLTTKMRKHARQKLRRTKTERQNVSVQTKRLVGVKSTSCPDSKVSFIINCWFHL